MSREVRLTNLGRVLFPETGFTKGDLVHYYREVAPAILPHIAHRPLTLVRFPEGVHGPGWFQTNVRGNPDWLPVAEVTGKRGQPLRFALVNETDALVWVANQGTIELHPGLATAERPDEPLELVLDLDPGPPAGIVDCVRVALELRDRLGLPSFANVSGSAGVHVHVPLAPGHGFEATKAFARELARTLARERPEAVIDRMSRAERRGKVFIDWGQNDRSRTLAAPWSLRAGPRPLVAVPISWGELEDAPRLEVSPAEALARIEEGIAVTRVGRGRLPARAA